MTQGHDHTSARDEADRYEIRLRGRLDEHWAAWFDGSTISHESDGVTVLRGYIPDQAALYGLLQRVRDLGLPLVSVTRVEGDQPDQTIPDARERSTPSQGD